MQGNETQIGEISRDLARLRRRAARQKRSIEISADGWQQWSATMDEITSLTQRLVASPAPDLASMATNFRAILWLIEVNESLLDSGDLRRLRRFGLELSSLARD